MKNRKQEGKHTHTQNPHKNNNKKTPLETSVQGRTYVNTLGNK